MVLCAVSAYKLAHSYFGLRSLGLPFSLGTVSRKGNSLTNADLQTELTSQQHEKSAYDAETKSRDSFPLTMTKSLIGLIRYNAREKEILAAIANAGADVNSCDLDGTPLHYAAKLQNGEPIVRALIAAGADVNALNIDDETPLINAVENKNGENIVRVLLEAGADVNVVIPGGRGEEG